MPTELQLVLEALGVLLGEVEQVRAAGLLFRHRVDVELDSPALAPQALVNHPLEH